MIDNSENDNATIYFEELSVLVPLLRERSLSGIVPRYLSKVVPNGKVPFSHHQNSAAFAIGGVPLRRPETAFHWIFGENNVATSALCQFLKQSLDRPKLCFHPGIKPTIQKHFPEDRIAADHFFLSQARSEIPLPENCKVQTFNSMPPDLKFNREIINKLPPKEIWDECKFQYAGLEVDGTIEATIEYTVDDGEFCILQQVYTSEQCRRRGHAKTLLTALSNAMHKQAIMPALIISSNNIPSILLAQSAGFALIESFGVVEY